MTGYAVSAVGGAALICLSLWPGAASAQWTAQGTYRRTGGVQQTATVRAATVPGEFLGSFSVSARNCTGEVDAKGVAETATRIVFDKRDDTDEVCKITMTFAPDYSSATVSEDGCLFWHGASCDFDGSLKRVNR